MNLLKTIRTYGTFPMAYSTLQPRLEYFRHHRFDGFIAYKKVGGRAVVLSNPVCDPGNYRTATQLFQQRYRRMVVCQATAAYANVLHDMGFYVTGFGVDNVISMSSFEVNNRVRSNLHRFETRVRNLGFFVEEGKGDAEALQAISQEWLVQKQNKQEFSFLARPFVSNREEDVRLFLLKENDRVHGFASFDPIYSDDQSGQVVSYVLQHLRVDAQAPRGAADYLLIAVLKLFKMEGLSAVSIGLSLMHQRAKPKTRPSFLVEKMLDMFYDGNLLYKCRSVAEHKDRYHARKVPTFMATSHRHDIFGNLAIMKANGLFG